MAYGDQTKRIADTLAADRQRPYNDIAEELGVKPVLVRNVAQKFDLCRRALKTGHPFRLSWQNRNFIAQEAESMNVSFYEALDSIVTDARVEAE